MRNLSVITAVIGIFLLAAGTGCTRGPAIEPPLEVKDVITWVSPWDSDGSLGNPNYPTTQQQVTITLTSNKPGSTFTLQSAPSYGAVSGLPATAAPDGYSVTVTYAPQEDTHLTDRFTVLVTDVNGETETCTVSVDINLKPIIPADQSFDFAGSASFYTGTLSASDPDGDPVTFYVSGLSKGIIKINQSTGTFEYRPHEPYQIQGVDAFKIWVKDGFLTGVSTKEWIYIGVNDTAPEGVELTFYVYDDKEVLMRLQGKDEDGDEHFIFEITGAPPTYGTVSTVDKYEGKFIYLEQSASPEDGDPPSYIPDGITFRVSDGVKWSDDTPVTIQIIYDQYFCDYLDWYNWLAPERFEFVPIVDGTFQMGLIHVGEGGKIGEYKDLKEFDLVHNIYPYYSILPIPYTTELPAARDNEHPMHPVMLSRGKDNYAFWITRCEITNAQFAEFLSAPEVNAAVGTTVYQPVYADYTDSNRPAWLTYYGKDKPYYFLSGYHDINRVGSKIVYNTKYNYFEVEDQTFAEHPVVNVTWFGAMAFCQWLEHRDFTDDGYTYEYRLPTEAEWEYVAHGQPPGTWVYRFQPYPWNVLQTDWGNVYCPMGSYEKTDPPYLRYNVIFGDLIIDGEDLEWHWVVPPGDPPSYPDRVMGTAPVGFLATGIRLTMMSEPAPGPIYDIIGNVWELCWEEYDEEYYQKLVNHMGGDGWAVVDPPDPALPWTHPDWSEEWTWDRILPHNLANRDRVIIRGGGWGGDAYDRPHSNPPFDLGRGLASEGFAIDGRCEMWRITDRCEMEIHADQGYNKIGFRVVRRVH